MHSFQPPISAGRWAEAIKASLPAWIASQPALAAIHADLDIVLHGSTTAGIDDPWSDLDLWGFISSDSLSKADSLSPTRFYDFKLNGKPGHLNLETREHAFAQIHRCNMERIAEARRAIVLHDATGRAAEMLELARQPIPESVRRSLVMYHYIEMRSEHRACDTPIERGDATALLLATTPVVAHALRCAMIIDAQPYPYIKWLGAAASQTPTGRCVYEKVQDLLAILAQGGLTHAGPESSHPLALKMRQIRAILIDAARASGIDEPWLSHWWLWLTQAKDALRSANWPCVLK